MGFSAKNFLFEQFNKSCKENNIPTPEPEMREVSHVRMCVGDGETPYKDLPKQDVHIKDGYIEDGNLHFIKEDGEDISIDTRELMQPFMLIGVVDDLSKIKGHPGEIYVEASTNNIYTWIDNEWILISESIPEPEAPKPHGKRTKKIIPYPSHCKSCGSPLHNYVCKYCNTEYPSFEYILEEETY